MSSLSPKANLKPYFEAARKILGGTRVPNLEVLRQRLSRDYAEAVITREKPLKRGYIPCLVVASFVADAENRILEGETPKEAYGVLNRDTDVQEARRKGRRILEDTIKEIIG